MALQGVVVQLVPMPRDVEELPNNINLEDFVREVDGFRVLDLAGFTQLKRLPDSIGQLASLRQLNLSGCSGLQTLPDSIGQLASLQELNLSGCSGLQTLPDSIGQLASLRQLILSGCSGLQTLPADSIGQLASLRQLNVSGCSGLQKLPDNLEFFEHLVVYRMHSTMSLYELDLSGCSGLEELPDAIWQLERLERLDLSGCCKLKETLSDSIGQLAQLWDLNLSGCSRLYYLPETLVQLTRLRRLNLSGCTGLADLPDKIGQLAQLQELNLFGCSQMNDLPPSTGQLIYLASLDLTDCNKMTRLPDLGICRELILKINSYDPKKKLTVPYDYLPPWLQDQLPEFIVSQADALQQSMASISWVSILLATASFIGFIEVPASWNDAGLAKVDSSFNGPATLICVGALRAYFVFTMLTFFIALATTMYCITENLPHHNPPTADRVIVILHHTSFLLMLSVMTGIGAFLSGAFAVYPDTKRADVIGAAVGGGIFILFTVYRYLWRIYCLARAVVQSHKIIPTLNFLEVTSSDRANSQLLKRLLFETVQARNAPN